jgi:hypothetical protein
VRLTKAALKSLAAEVERWRIASANVTALVAEAPAPVSLATCAAWDEWNRRYEAALAQENRAAFQVAVHADIVCEDAGLVPKRDR